MATDTSLQALVDDYTQRTIMVDAPATYVCPIYKTLMGNQSDFDDIVSLSPLSFAPGLQSVLEAPEPPCLDFFFTLPTPTSVDYLWAIYAIVLQKPGCTPKLYIGSATNAIRGVWARYQNYIGRTRLPQYVQLAFTSGYTMSHWGMIC